VPTFNFNFQIALLHGQLGNTQKMISTFLDEAFANPQNSFQIQNQLARFMMEDGDEGFNETLRKDLIIRVQKNQDIFWNQYLSWFYVQQKEFGKAFIQEKAIYKRNPESLIGIVSLGDLAAEEGQSETAKEIFEFVIQNTQEIALLIQAQTYLLQLKIDQSQEKDWITINTEINNLLSTYGISPMTLEIQLLQAHFLAFRMQKISDAKAILKNTLELPLNPFETAKVKMELADILLLEEKYNQALLYYSQIEDNLKNDALAHEASLKAAKTSYFQGDFDWALKQFTALKSASTQLIANDALEYFLLLTDNTVADSTQTALKKFAKGDYLWYQNRNQEAIHTFQEILNSFKGQDPRAMHEQAEHIEPVTLLRLGKIYEKQAEYLLALTQFQNIINQHQESIYIDEALFFAAEIYNKKTNEPDKAKSLYEKLIFNHQDSIYFIEARKEYRQLRGDKNL
jgi:tetratricopeptide (TPR) repeat protein